MKKGLRKPITGLLFASVMMLFAGFLSNCDNSDNGDEGPASLTGKYTFKKAVLTSEVVVNDQAAGSSATITLPVGTDVTDMVIGGLLGAVSCGSTSNAAIDMRANKELWAFCNGENVDPVRGGTWSENATRTVLVLNLAPPLVISAVNLQLTNIAVAGNNLSGNLASMPMSGALMETHLDDSLIPEGFIFPVIILMDVKIDFTKI